MNREGLAYLKEAFEDAEINATITPEPKEDENARFVTVETDSEIPPARVLNALGEAGLMYFAGEYRDACVRYTPELKPIGVQSGSLTFEDTNDIYNRMY